MPIPSPSGAPLSTGPSSSLKTMLLPIVIFGLSLCADCFAVSLCSSTTLKRTGWKDILPVALIFAVVQTGFLLAGWALGHLVVSLVIRIARWIGFLLLLYVGGSMFLEGTSKGDEIHDMSGLRNVLLCGVATSIDAFAVGVSLAMGGENELDILYKGISVFACTFLSVVAGIAGGKAIGHRAGSWAQIIGGLVLVGIGISILLK